MKISDRGLAALKHEEGCRLTAYPDSRGVWTIGTGHTGRVDGVAVHKGMTITRDTADRLLRDDLSWVERCIADRVTVPLNQNQYDALCSLIFNIGDNAFIGSTVRRQLNAGNYTAAADAFLEWSRAGSNKTLLAPRRGRERAMFLGQG
ncbi:lysozyme [Salmonella enterica]|nr:lysozyme [Salmonella enterica subsp. enterica serovar Infantis]EBQ9779253.1 lysozyme [Salmonella enterica subsp. enterica serovar Inganda]EHT6566230.1 lysozyme [Salmonella enterica]EEA0252530.1 glycoside hydrolase family protein [Salmonella enterica subsp. enterica serovar Infantis]EIJ9583237.1 lysozyme [Salmonella enterica]